MGYGTAQPAFTCSKLTIERLEQIVKYDLVLVFLLLTLNLLLGGYYDPAGIYLIKDNNGNSRVMYEIYSKLTMKTLEISH